MNRIRFWLALGCIGAAVILDAQIIGPPGTGYPGGRYPGGGYPGGGYPGGGVGIPGRGRKQKTQDTQDAAKLVQFTGSLQELTDHTLSITLEDSRNIAFKRTAKTKFYKKGSNDAAASDFHPGDRTTVEATQDDNGYYTAVNVRLENDGNKPESANSEAKIETSKSDDPDRPVLHRGAPAKKQRSDDAQETSAESSGTMDRPSLRLGANGNERLPDPVMGFGDPFLDKAYDAAISFIEGLPNYVCQQFVARYQSSTRVPNWHAYDIVSYDLVYQDGREDYRNPKINGKPVANGEDQKTGSWSSGEFGTILRALFSLGRSANFHFVKETTIAKHPARVYDYSVAKSNSRWNVIAAAQTYDPAYKGSIWIDKENARVLRIEMQAVSLPDTFPLDTVESSVDYDYIRLDATRQFLLPVKAETLSCERGSFNCTRNSIDFRNYHKYSGEATITFDK